MKPISANHPLASTAVPRSTDTALVITDRGKLAYTVAQAVRASGIGRTTLYELMRNQRLEARKLGKRTLIPADALRVLLASLPVAQNSRM